MAQVTRVWQAALDACRRDLKNYRPQAEWMAELGKVSEGTQTTLGAYSQGPGSKNHLVRHFLSSQNPQLATQYASKG